MHFNSRLTDCRAWKATQETVSPPSSVNSYETSEVKRQAPCGTGNGPQKQPGSLWTQHSFPFGMQHTQLGYHGLKSVHLDVCKFEFISTTLSHPTLVSKPKETFKVIL